MFFVSGSSKTTYVVVLETAISMSSGSCPMIWYLFQPSRFANSGNNSSFVCFFAIIAAQRPLVDIVYKPE